MIHRGDEYMINRYQNARTWYKGNTHIHTTLSDGGKTPHQIAQLYTEAGYDFIAITDHWNSFNKEQYDPQINSSTLLILDGIEIDGYDEVGHYYHVVALGTFPQLQQSEKLSEAIEALLPYDPYLILAHPYWSGNRREDMYQFPFQAIEIYNHVTDSLNGKSSALVYWDERLRTDPQFFGIAADDAHIIPAHPGFNGGWIMVCAEDLNKESIIDALRSGRFYATRGPEFHSIDVSENVIRCTTSPIKRAWLVGEAYYGARFDLPREESFTEFSFTVPTGSSLSRSSYLRLEIEDEQGKRAWSNTL